jgi:hypothetical protein
MSGSKKKHDKNNNIIKQTNRSIKKEKEYSILSYNSYIYIFL